VLRPGGAWAAVTGAEAEARRAAVYNFEVADNHNYFVGAHSILVHNTCIFAERKLLGSGKHGVNWTEGAARAKSTGLPQGQFGSVADVDFAVSKGRELGPGNKGIFDLPEGHTSIVHLPDGTTAPASKVFLATLPSDGVLWMLDEVEFGEIFSI
jgi:hypothetical protein